MTHMQQEVTHSADFAKHKHAPGKGPIRGQYVFSKEKTQSF